jgi:hypothetical protein
LYQKVHPGEIPSERIQSLLTATDKLLSNKSLLAKEALSKMVGSSKRLMEKLGKFIDPEVIKVQLSNGKEVTAESLLKAIKSIKYGFIGAAVLGAVGLIGTYVFKGNKTKETQNA